MTSASPKIASSKFVRLVLFDLSSGFRRDDHAAGSRWPIHL